MAKYAMMRRAFNQAASRHSVSETGQIIKYIIQYAKKNEVEISEEEIRNFVWNQREVVKN